MYLYMLLDEEPEIFLQTKTYVKNNNFSIEFWLISLGQNQCEKEYLTKSPRNGDYPEDKYHGHEQRCCSLYDGGRRMTSLVVTFDVINFSNPMFFFSIVYVYHRMTA